ncbi:MAG: hypothetical protein AAF532_15085 [Planctomycetota bacterium]
MTFWRAVVRVVRVVEASMIRRRSARSLGTFAVGFSIATTAATSAAGPWDELTPPRRLPPELVEAAKPLVSDDQAETAVAPRLAPSVTDGLQELPGPKSQVVDAAVHPESALERFAGLPVSAEEGVAGDAITVARPGGSDGEARRAALSQIPWGELDAEGGRTARAVTANAGLFRRFPLVRSKLSPDVYDLFASEPDIAVAIWRVMGIARCDVRQTAADKYAIDAGECGGGTMTVLYRDAENLILSAVGTFSGPPLVKDVRSAAVVHVRVHAGTADARGRADVEAEGSLFVAFPSSAVDAVARVISPMTHRVIDQNFREVALFIRLMDGTMRRRPDWVDAVATRMTGVTAGQAVRLRTVAYEVHGRDSRTFDPMPRAFEAVPADDAADEFDFRPVSLDTGSKIPVEPARVGPGLTRTAARPSVGTDSATKRTARSRAGRRAAPRP